MSKTINPALQAHLNSGATTMCHCWRITRRDNLVQGFTEHDENLFVDGTLFQASTGFTASQIQQSLGLAVDNMNVEGALSASSLNEEDLSAGKYDDAYVELLWVNWKDPTQFLVKLAGFTGETKRMGVAFSAELRGLTSRLGQVQTNTYVRSCSAVLGDKRCKVNLQNSTFKGIGTVLSVQGPRSFIASGLNSFSSTWFNQGVLTWTSGPLTGITTDVKNHVQQSSSAILELWGTQPFEPQINWTFTVIAGCQLTKKMCKNKFNNLENFRGFPYMPGPDAVIKNPDPNARNQGSSTSRSSK